jgi:WD40 repeat protein
MVEVPPQFTDERFSDVRIFGNQLISQISNDKLFIWNIESLRSESMFYKEKYISSFTTMDNFLFVATEGCMEIMDDCHIRIWDLNDHRLNHRLGEWMTNDYYYDLKFRRMSSFEKPVLLALNAYILDIWEYGTWRHLTQLNNLPWAQNVELYENYIFISDVNGDIQIWEKKSE